MSKVVSRDQALQLMAVVSQNIDWEAIDAERLQTGVISLPPTEIGRRFTQFLSGGCQIMPLTLAINRLTPFGPQKSIGSGWSFWRGPADGDGLQGGEIEQDHRSVAMTTVVSSMLVAQTGLVGKETFVTGEVKRERLLKETPQIDAQMAWAMYEEGGQKMLRWIHDNLGLTWFEVMGTPLRGPCGSRAALCFCRESGGSWDWHCSWLGSSRDVSGPALGLASPSDSGTVAS